VATDPDNVDNKIDNVLIAVRWIWSALGDDNSTSTIRSNEVSHRNFSRADLDNAAKKAYSSASARALDQQANAVMQSNEQFTAGICSVWLWKGGRAANMQATKYFLGTSLRVEKLLPSDIVSDIIPSEFDLLFISIHAFKDLIDKHPQQLRQWNIKKHLYHEYHNIFGELFRHSNSWTSLRNLARHQIKINLLSATANNVLMDFVSHYLSLGN
jgi:hypothetical protein